MMNKKEFSNELRLISAAISDRFEVVSYIEAGALFREHIAEYLSALDYLIRIVEREISPPVETIEQVCRRLCELSREVLFAADVDRLQEPCIVLTSQLFKLAVKVIHLIIGQDQFAQVAQAISVYLGNIEKRAVDNPWDSIAFA